MESQFLSLYFLNAACVVTLTPSNSMLLPLWSVHVCAVLSGCHRPLLRLAGNNAKSLKQASLLNCACRLDHYDVIASLAYVQIKVGTPKNVIYGNSLGPNTSCVAHNDWKHGFQTQLVSLCPQFNTIRAIAVIVCGSDSAQLIFMNNLAAMPGSVTAVRHEFQWKYREFGSFVL